MTAEPETLELRLSRWPFVQVPSALVTAHGISDGAVRTYAALAMWAGRGGRAWPSKAKLAEARGVGRSALFAHLAQLEESGWIRRWDDDRPGGASVGVVELLPSPELRTTPVLGSGLPPSWDPDTERDPRKENQEVPPSPPKGGETETPDRAPERAACPVSPDPPSGPRHGAPAKRRTALAPTAEESALFARWWALVPRRVGRERALVSFVRCARGHGGPTGTLELPSEEKLAAATRGWAERAAREASEPRFIAHPSTWLNAAGFDDEEGVTAGPTPEELAARRAAKAARDEETKERITREAEESYMREWRGQEGH